MNTAIGLSDLEATFTVPASGGYHPNTYMSNTYVPGPATPYQSYGGNQTSDVYSSGYQLPSSGQASGQYSHRQGSSRYGPGLQSNSSKQMVGAFRQTSRMSAPLRLSNLQGPSVPVAQEENNPLQDASSSKKLDESLGIDFTGPDPLYAKLTDKNYVSKFKRLVEVEKTAHEGILRER